jgi:ATP-dependent DNA helicase RecG
MAAILNKHQAELLRRVHMVEAWGRRVPLILEKEPGVQFREIAKL